MTNYNILHELKIRISRDSKMKRYESSINYVTLIMKKGEYKIGVGSYHRENSAAQKM